MALLSQNTSTVFLYTPLDRSVGEIRLIKLLPATDNSSIIHCTIENVNYQDPPPYQALSYVWGNAEITEPILLNRTAFPVTTNLAKALHYLRNQFCGRDALTLWVDAICINQKDKLEQGHQVQLMREIYSKALSCFLWTGELNGDGRAAMDMMNALSSNDLDGNDATTWDTVSALKMIDNWKALYEFFERPFWQRVWILQEFVLAPTLLLVCGDTFLDYQTLERAFMTYDAILRREQECLTHFGTEISTAIFSSSFKQLHLFIRYRSMSDQPHLLDLLVYSQFLKATDPRDKVYGLLGMQDGELDIIPNYEKSVADVFFEVSKSLIEIKATAVLLLAGCECGLYDGRNMTYNVPSWVCDWNKLQETNYKSEFMEHKDRFGAAGTPGRDLDRRTQDISISIIPHSTYLKTSGIVCEVITDFAVTGFQTILDFWQRFRTGQTPAIHPTGMPILQALFRTLIMDCPAHESMGRISDHPEKFASYSVGFFAYLCNYARDENGDWIQNPEGGHMGWLLSWLNESRDGRSDEEILESAFLGSYAPELRSQIIWPKTEGGIGAENLSVWGPFILLMSRVLDKSFLVTRNGYFGLGPKHVQKGDLVCAIMGCRLLFVLRKVEHYFLLVGCCFVLGFVDGEAVKALEEGKLVLQSFEIH